jgi:hypothetical protein
MKHVKLLGLAVLAGALLMAIVGSGTAIGATNFCTTQESPCPEANRWAAGTTLDFTVKSGTSAALVTTTGEALDTCTGGTVKGKMEKAEPVTDSIESLTWTGCTFPTTTTKLGKLEVTNSATAHNGTVKADSEIGVTINGGFFGSCIYGVTAGTDLGELKEGKPATFVANAVAERLTGSALACPETAKWTAEYTLTEPSAKTLSVENGIVTPSPNLCTVQESPCSEANRWAAGTILDFSVKTGTSAGLVTTTGEALDTCTGGTVKGKLEKAEPPTGSIESLTWTGCTFPTTTTKLGKLEILHIAGTHNGTVKADAEIGVTVNGGFFGSCVYGVTAGTSLGTITEGKPATFTANAVAEKLTGSAFACPETAKWTAEYTLTEPKEKTLSVETGVTVTKGTVFCTLQEQPCAEANRWAAGTSLDFSNKAGTSALLTTTAGEPIDTCTGSTVKGKIEKAVGITDSIESLTWTGCTFPTTTTKLGKLTVEKITGTHNGTVKGDSEIGVTMNTVFFGSCVYGVIAGTDLGTLTEGKPATFDANAVAIKLTGSAFACPETAKWTATYTLTEPGEKTLAVETN